ncbi:hypothetical protein [Aureimonas psammosilenae]|uniref:hypothetical protein n=1 Tax=Aureimonas psammosilenae TaxID=2495496 RepID=UPI00126130B8|nr:hypothetical protein [Aureimonas psammosilenae]
MTAPFSAQGQATFPRLATARGDVRSISRSRRPAHHGIAGALMFGHEFGEATGGERPFFADVQAPARN